ncbi:class I tRNA ligase family protein, partial [Plesiomonas shigelloides]
MNSVSDAELRGTRHTLIHVLDGLLRMAHPSIPLTPEYIWQRVNVLACVHVVFTMLQPFPEYYSEANDVAALQDLLWIKQLI